MLVRFGLIIAAVGAVVAWLGFQEVQLTGVADAEPQVMTCAELEANGPGDNAHVKISDFLLVGHAFVYEQEEGSSTYTNVWVPCTSLYGEYGQRLGELYLREQAGETVDWDAAGPPKTLKIIVKSSRVSSDQQLSDLGDQETLQGLIVNKIESLSGDERKILADSYPGVDFDDVWILEHGREPSSSGSAYGQLGGGVVALFLGLLFAWRGWQGGRKASPPAARRGRGASGAGPGGPVLGAAPEGSGIPPSA